MHPYRTQPESSKATKKLPRGLARARRAFYRVVLPLKFIFWGGAIFTVINLMVCDNVRAREKRADETNKQHFDDWQKAIDANQRNNDARVADIERRDRELNARVHSFEDTVALSPLLINTDKAALTQAVQRFKTQ